MVNGNQFLKLFKPMKKVGIIDYEMGNINSIINSLKYLGYGYKVTNLKEEIDQLPMLILPGVGSFKQAMLNIKRLKLFDELKNQSTIKKKKILGICLGMQILGCSSTEDGLTDGLNLVENKVTKFEFKNSTPIRVPHVGFNNISYLTKDFSLFKNINLKDNFYFVHSYKMNLQNNTNYALCNYGTDFLAAFQKENIFGVQFHPEKSQSSGIQLLNNFLNI